MIKFVLLSIFTHLLSMKTENIYIQALKKELVFYIGRNQSENFEIIDKCTLNDLWFHANNISSCHVVGIIPEDISKKDKKYIIKIGASLCKKYTKKLKPLNDVEIVYTQLKNIEKTSVLGCVNITNSKIIII